MSRLLIPVIGGLMLLATLVHAYRVVEGLRGANDVRVARVSMRRLAALTIRNFPDKNLESAPQFWKSIGRDTPIKDAWGTDYVIDQFGAGVGKKFFWRCAGPDRRWGTLDDIQVEVPYSGLPISEIDPMDLQAPVSPSLNAK